MSSKARRRLATKGRQTTGQFLMIPKFVLEHPAFKTLSPRASKLYLDIGAQYRGHNNGDLSATLKMMSDRGWNSSDQLNKAKRELEQRGLILLTRQGGRNCCNLYALTCFPINECNGKIDIEPTQFAPNNFKKWSAPKCGVKAA